jgi:L-ascorbate metabolism protein UlaG (beta-lactamase superfamily)
MKIQFFGNSSFLVEGKSAKVAFDPVDLKTEKLDIAMNSKGEEPAVEAKKILTLPGEYDISDVLVRGFHIHEGKNTVFKITIEDVVIAHFGDLPSIPKATFFDALGENVDVALLTLREGFDAKSAKEFLEKVDPRMVIFGGDAAAFPKIVELFNAKILPESDVSVSRTNLPSEATNFVILSA